MTVVKSKVEDLTLEVGEVDVIISEWMGYCLVYEGMLSSVLMARFAIESGCLILAKSFSQFTIYPRDKFLKKGGVMLPNLAHVFINGISDGWYYHLRTGWMRQNEDFDLSDVKETVVSEAVVATVKTEYLITTAGRVASFDLEHISVEEARSFSSDFALRSVNNVCGDPLHALVIHFEVEFTRGSTPLSLKTSPDSPLTHWHHCVVLLDVSMEIHS